MIKLIKQPVGHDAVAIGVSGTENEINATMLSLWNWAAIDSCLHLGSPETFQYGISTEARMLSYFHAMGELAFDCERISSPSLETYLNYHAAKSWESIPDETFLRYGQEFTGEVNPTTPGWENSDVAFFCRD